MWEHLVWPSRGGHIVFVCYDACVILLVGNKYERVPELHFHFNKEYF
jgi:hypothetical protein